MRPRPPDRRRAAPFGNRSSLVIASHTSSHHQQTWASVCITEGVSPAMRLADLRGLERGLCDNLLRFYERGDWVGARNQIDALETCCRARRALLP